MVQVGEKQEDIADFGGDEVAEWVQENRRSAKRGEGSRFQKWAVFITDTRGVRRKSSRSSMLDIEYESSLKACCSPIHNFDSRLFDSQPIHSLARPPTRCLAMQFADYARGMAKACRPGFWRTTPLDLNNLV